MVVNMTDKDLEALGIARSGDIKEILAQAKALKEELYPMSSSMTKGVAAPSGPECIGGDLPEEETGKVILQRDFSFKTTRKLWLDASTSSTSSSQQQQQQQEIKYTAPSTRQARAHSSPENSTAAAAAAAAATISSASAPFETLPSVPIPESKVVDDDDVNVEQEAAATALDVKEEQESAIAELHAMMHQDGSPAAKPNEQAAEELQAILQDAEKKSSSRAKPTHSEVSDLRKTAVLINEVLELCKMIENEGNGIPEIIRKKADFVEFVAKKQKKDYNGFAGLVKTGGAKQSEKNKKEKDENGKEKKKQREERDVLKGQTDHNEYSVPNMILFKGKRVKDKRKYKERIRASSWIDLSTNPSSTSPAAKSPKVLSGYDDDYLKSLSVEYAERHVSLLHTHLVILNAILILITVM